MGVGDDHCVDMTIQRSAGHAVPWLPQPRIDWWTVLPAGFNTVSVVLILLAVVSPVLELPARSADTWAVTGWGLTIWATWVACVVAGVVAATRRHERSRMVVVATLF